MYEKLINHSPDLQRLTEEGYALEIRDGYLIILDVPYVTAKATIARGSLVTDLQENGGQTIKPKDHQVWFTGEFPCKKNGSPIEALRHTDKIQTLCNDLIARHRFSCKPPEGYPDFYEKMTRYIEIINNPALSIDPMATAKIFKPIIMGEEDVFYYADTASSRYGITALSQKCAMNKVAIVGLGGTGSYILDLIAKCHLKEIHLFDGDRFIGHNAFRAPGAASLEILNSSPTKVAYYAELYGQMRRFIYPHEVFIDENTVNQLVGFNFVFICVDKPSVRKLLFDFLNKSQIPFIDTGMELEHIEECQSLIGTCRITFITPEKNDHLSKYVSIQDAKADEVYDQNIQVAELNAMNATLAVIRWKKYCTYYQDIYHEHQSTYTINTHQLSKDEVEYKPIE